MNFSLDTIFQKFSSGKLLGLGSALRGTCAVRGAGAAFLAVAAIAVAAPTARADSLTATKGVYWFDPHETGTDRSDNYIYDDALLVGDSKNFSWPLATMSFELACVSFSSEREENTPEGYANKCRNVKAYLEDNGFVDFDTNQDYKEKMTVQSMGVACAHKRIPDSESETGETTVLAIVPRCAGYEAEWDGNFVMGETGDHAGFAHGKDKVLEFAKAYIETNSISGRIKV